MKVLVNIESYSLGDSVAAVAVISKYQKQNNHEVTVICNYPFLFINSYPDLNFLNRNEPITDSYDKKINTLCRFELPLIEGYAKDFDITTDGIIPKVDSVNNVRPIKNKYVCIGVHSTAQCKYWNYPDGWDTLCRMFRKKGITPVVVERDELFGIEGHMNGLPQSAVKKVGMKFSDVINHIQHCEFYIGLSSGLSWVAQGLGKPTVIISNVTSKDHEFVDRKTLRIYNEKICHGCIHKEPFDSTDWLWCPAYRDDDLRRHLCTKLITPTEVMKKIENFFYI